MAQPTKTIRFDTVMDSLPVDPPFDMDAPVTIRPEIMAMATRLEKQMRYNEARGKSYGWVVAQPNYLIRKLEDEFNELGNELVMEPDFDEKKVQHEAMDVIAVAYFIWFQSTLREAFQEEQKLITKMDLNNSYTNRT